MINNKKIAVIMPAYNAEKTLEQTYNELYKDIVDEIILVDDNSSDKTKEVAKKLGITTLVHDKNKGYGGNQKTCYTAALKTDADIVIMVHPDYQYTPKLVPAMATMLAFDEYDACIASRFIGKGALEGGMPLYKFIANKCLTLFQNLMMGERLTEYHTGFRAFTREVLEKCPLKDCDDDFVFDNEMLALIFYKGYTIGQISCPTKYFPDASSINFMRSCKYGFGVLKTSILFALAKWGIYKSKIFRNDAKTLDKNEELPYFKG
ncbi:MAG TPA: glycosyltransferase family 2 protein [Candidatus Limenecus avicola]|uniref:Glycosyltransferase family 2 protein n=1 Tax=Candidatus Limenecus avicola TaxID=2840847 RepID=A0A9D1N2C9_9CLOT|nr:glycosyltransferase family 2 protein [Candidatus Limenecus avicola]